MSKKTKCEVIPFPRVYQIIENVRPLSPELLRMIPRDPDAKPLNQRELFQSGYAQFYTRGRGNI